MAPRGRPRKSTLNAFVDMFCEMSMDQQEKALDLMNFEHRRAQIRAKKEPRPEPAQGSLEAQS